MKKGMSTAGVIFIVVLAIVIGAGLLSLGAVGGFYAGRLSKNNDEKTEQVLEEKNEVKEDNSKKEEEKDQEKGQEENSEEQNKENIELTDKVDIEVERINTWESAPDEKKIKDTPLEGADKLNITQFKIEVENKSDETIAEHWRADVIFDDDVAVSELWNAKYTQEGNTLHITTDNWQQIEPDKDREIGFQIYSKNELSNPKVKIFAPEE